MKIDHVHFYVEDARGTRDWFVRYLGFQAVGSGVRSGHTCTEVVKSGSVCFLLSSPLTPVSPVAQFLRQQPPGVADVAFCVEDVEVAIARAQAHGAKVLEPIQQRQQGQEYLKWGKIAAWGSLTHTLIERTREDKGTKFFPSLPPLPSLPTLPSLNAFTAIDHVVLNVAGGDLERAVAWYQNTLDFQPQQTFKIQTDRSALYSQVMVARNGGVQFPINEPASASSQIQEFLDVNRGPGIQHIALHTPNIISAITQFRACGLPLLPVPPSYYTQLRTRQGLPLSLDELEAIAQQEILVDWQEDAAIEDFAPLLLQIFTQPIFAQPTFFFELIERRSQAQGFGEGNFRALFEAIEQEQLKRGSLQ